MHRGRGDLDGQLLWLAENTNADGFTGPLKQAVVGADVFIGVSVPGVIDANDVAAMAPDAVVFAWPTRSQKSIRARPSDSPLSRPVDPTSPTRSTMCSPSPACSAACWTPQSSDITPAMLLAAAQALASVVTDDELNSSYIMPSVFHPDVHKVVARRGANLHEGSCPFARRDANDRPGRESSR